MGRSKNILELSWCLGFLACLVSGGAAKAYYGTRIGRLVPLEHQVKGDVWAVDSRTIHIRGFSYDGAAPDAFFYAGTTSKPSDAGFIIPDENGGVQPLGAYRNKDLTLTLPDKKTLKDIKWISVWCRAYSIDFGHVMVSSGLDYPRPQKVEALPTFQHGVSSDRVVVVDAQTFLIPDFSYDGQAPDAFFWVGKGTPDNSGTVVPDENGSEKPLKRYSRKTIVITLPGELTVFDIDYLGLWCRAFTADFGHIRLPRTLNVPPSLKMLGVAPQSKLNCEVLWDDLAIEVRWAVAGESIVMQLVGRIADGQYMSFGTSGSATRSSMVGGDVVVAWLDQVSGRGEAQDYHLGAKSQCQGGRGSCPDEEIQGSRNNVRLLNAALINDFTMLTFQRPLAAADPSDMPILTNGSQAVIWAVGPVNSQGHTSYHSLRLRGDMFVDFGRTPEWNCPVPEEQPSSNRKLQSGPSKPQPAPAAKNAWEIPPIPCNEPEDGVMYAQIGPTGGDSGYNSITGHVGWGIAWYINGLLIPEINVVRGKTYTFVVEGGNNPDRPERDHPFYITDDPEGGYSFKTPAERSRVQVFAGVDQDRERNLVPSGLGRLCEWVEDPNQPAGDFTSFGAYQRTLQLNCEEGQPGVLQWTPDANTPDTVYYQCYTHRYLGWKIRVLDSCDLGDLTAAGSNTSPVVVPGSAQSDYDYYDLYDDGLKPHPGLATRFQSNKISGEGTFAKPPQSKDSAEEAFPHFSDYHGDFYNFPFHLGPAAASPVVPTSPPRRGSTQAIPLGAPGFTFPKLPNLKSSTGFVNISAFNNFNGSSLGDEEFPSHLQNQYPLSSPPTAPSISFSDKQATFSKINSVSSSTFTHLPSTPTWKDLSRIIPQDKTVATLSTSTFTHPVSTLTTSTSTLSHPTRSPYKPSYPTQASTRNSLLSRTSTRSHPTHASLSPPSKTSLRSQHHTTRHSSTQHKSFPTVIPHTPTRPVAHSQTPLSQTHKFPKAASSSGLSSTVTRHPNHQPTHAHHQPTHTHHQPTHPHHQPTRPNHQPTRPHHQPTRPHHQPTRPHHQPTHRHPEVITAPSLPPLPGQAPPQVQQHIYTPPPRRDHPLPRPTYSPTPVSLADTFAQTFGFDPESVVYESDFRPVRQHPPGPVLAFEVSPSSSRPINAPLPPRSPPFLHRVREGPRTSSRLRLAHRQIKVDSANKPQKEVELKAHADVGPNPIYHHSVTFSESHEPLPMPIPMGPTMPLLGGAAFNMPLKPARSSKPLRRRHRPRPPVRRAGPLGSVGRLGRPQTPARRLVASMIPLPEDHAVPVPQLVGPVVLQPVFPTPPPPSDRVGDRMPAASSPIFTSDGRPLPPHSISAPPRLATLHKQSSASITNRPKVGPYRGVPPPPVPAKVPHLAQFSNQRPPISRRTAVPMPPMPGTTPIPSSGYRYAGSAPRPVVVEAPKDLLVTASSETPSVPSPATPPGTNKTHMTILKNVWAILTQDHPRHEAHPAHPHHLNANQHLDGFEREPRRRSDEGD